MGRRIPGFSLVLGVSGSIIGTVIARLPFFEALGIVLGSTIVLFLVGLAVEWLRSQFIAFRKRLEALEEIGDEQKRLERWMSTLAGQAKQHTDSITELDIMIKELGVVSLIQQWKSEIRFISRIRETVLDANHEGRDKTVITQVLARRRPGPPIETFPVMISTDRKDVSFSELNYRIETPDVAEFLDYERHIVGERLVRFIILNKLLTPLTTDGGTVTFQHSTNANLDDPTDDWIGMEAGGDTQMIGIRVWFPTASWMVDYKEAFRGPLAVSKEVATPRPDSGVAEHEGRMRTYVSWSKSDLVPNMSYYIRWCAHDISAQVEPTNEATQPPSSDSNDGDDAPDEQKR